jgi:hypothetical protein
MNTDFLIKLESLQNLSQLYEDNEKILYDFLNYETELLNINKQLRSSKENVVDITIKLNRNNTSINLANIKSANFKKTQEQLRQKLTEKQTEFYEILLVNTELLSKLNDANHKRIRNICKSSLEQTEYDALKCSILDANSSATHTIHNLE